METSDEHLTDLTTVSFGDFDTKTSDKYVERHIEMPVPSDVSTRCCFSSYENFPTKHNISLDLKGDTALFAADQTPTPTRLIKNCDEVGLFEDLQHVNPFDIGFQRAAEQNAVSGQTLPATPTRCEIPSNENDSLHTPQVYPVESTSNVDPALDVSVVPDVPDVEELLATTTAPTLTPTPLPETPSSSSSCIVIPTPIQVLQPQVITWVLPTTQSAIKQPNAIVPVQTVRPFILPKPNAIPKSPTSRISPLPEPEPSSASLTPTSQLPIKERLKAIVNSKNKNRSFMHPPIKTVSKGNRNEDCLERRRAAASRYRNKMRNEHKTLQQENTQLQNENRELRNRIAKLEEALVSAKQMQTQPQDAAQIQIPPSSIHFVIQVPKMIVPAASVQHPS